MEDSNKEQVVRIAVVVPCYREREHILDVLSTIGPEVSHIFVVDDCCPDKTGDLVTEESTDARVTVLVHEKNKGVGGATITGYHAALESDSDVIVKLDGDGQMDATLIPQLVAPILAGAADYSKGNRLHRPGAARGMPFVRLFGNIVLTLLSKVSSGYWNIMDPTNGFTAIHAKALRLLPLSDIAETFFFESDMLCKLATVNAVATDVPMEARYGSEQSHLSIRRVIGPFLIGHLRNTWRRLVDEYFYRDIGIATLALIFGPAFLLFGLVFGSYHWILSVDTGVPATAGTVVLAALPILIGVQLLIMFLNQDLRRQPRVPIQASMESVAAFQSNKGGGATP